MYSVREDNFFYGLFFLLSFFLVKDCLGFFILDSWLFLLAGLKWISSVFFWVEKIKLCVGEWMENSVFGHKHSIQFGYYNSVVVAIVIQVRLIRHGLYIFSLEDYCRESFFPQKKFPKWRKLFSQTISHFD